MVLSGISFSLGNSIFLISKKVFDLKFSIYLPIIIFLLHPFQINLGQTTNFFFLYHAPCYFFFTKKFLFVSLRIFLSLSSLTYENFLIISPLVLILYFWANHHLKDNLFIFRLCYAFGILPFISIHFDLHSSWFKTFDLNSVFLELMEFL